MASCPEDPEDNFDQQLLAFLKENKIVVKDPNKFVDYIINSTGVYSFEDLKCLTIDDLKEEDTGLKKAQQRKFLDKVMFHKDSKMGGQFVSTSLYDIYGQGAVVDSMLSKEVTISVRYILCQDLYIKEAKQKVIIELRLNVNTIRDVIDSIRARENINRDHIVELFTHEGYPINVNTFNDECTLQKFGFQSSSLVYVFIRKKEQQIVANISKDWKKLDSNQGGHTLQIHSVLYGTFPVVSNVHNDTGETIKQRIFGEKGIHPDSFNILTRPKNHDYSSEKINHWTNDEIKQMFEDPSSGDSESHVVELMLSTKPMYACRGGFVYSYGKCTYNLMVEQTDKGFSKFYSILRFILTEAFGDKRDKILLFIHKEYHLPPLTYALKVLFQEKQLEQFPLWVSLVEGLFQVFAAILKKIGFEVPNENIFECSDYLWGMILKQSEKLKVSDCLVWKDISLSCKLSGNKMIEPVTLPRCSDVFEAQVILQRINNNTPVPNCNAQDLTAAKMKKATEIERLLMLCDFHDNDHFITWEVKNADSISPMEFPTDVDWKYILDAKQKLAVTSPTSQNNLSYYEDKMVFVIKAIKDDDLHRELYDPLYDPKKCNGSITVSKASLKNRSSNDFELKNYVKPSLRQSPLWDLFFKRKQESDATKSPPVIKQEPKESVVVVLDVSSSMKGTIFRSDSSESGKNMDRLTAAKQLLGSFLNRTEGFQYHHAVGLVSCSDKPKIEVPLTDDFEMFETIIQGIEAAGRTALYDSMMTASEMLMGLSKDYPKCKRRIFCLTDGEDNNSKCNVEDCFINLKKEEILLDSVLIIGPNGNINQKALSHGTGGFCFHPKSIKDAQKIFEAEPILSSGVRMIRQEPLKDSLSVYKDVKNYPYTETTFYGQPDLRTQFAIELNKTNFSNPARVIQHNIMFGQQTQRMSTGIQRILKEIQLYLENPHQYIDIYPQEENISRWKIVLVGPDSTPYEGGTFILYAKFPENYPAKPPEIRFETPIYHCNINSNGRICHSSLDTNYVPRVRVKTLLENIYGLLMAPEPADPLDSVLALEYKTHKELYERRARELVEKFAKHKDRLSVRQETIPEDDDAPETLVCPLTHKLFEDPVTTEFGHTYERKALVEYLSKNNNVEPQAGKPISVDRLTPNLNVKKMVQIYMKRSK